MHQVRFVFSDTQWPLLISYTLECLGSFTLSGHRPGNRIGIVAEEAGHGQVMYGLNAFQSTGNGEMYGESCSF